MRDLLSILGAVVVLPLVTLAEPALAFFNRSAVTEIYTSPDGSVQFVELFTIFDSQQSTTGKDIDARQTGQSDRTFTFSGRTPLPTAGHHLLIGNAAFEALGCATTDFTLTPTPFLYGPGGTVDFVGADIVSYTALPADGILSLGPDGTTTSTNSPTNYNGDTCSLDLSVLPPHPVPALTGWGLASISALFAAAGLFCLRSMRRCA